MFGIRSKRSVVMSAWTANYVAGMLRERAQARLTGNKELEAAVNRQLTAYGHKDEASKPVEDVTPEDVEQARSEPPKNRGGRPPRQTAAE